MADPEPFAAVTVPDTVSVSDVTATEVDPRHRAKLESLGKQDAGEWSNLWAAFWASKIDGPAAAIKQGTGLFDSLLATAVQLMSAAQGTNTEGFWQLAAAVTEDLTGVKVDATELQQAAAQRGLIGGNEQLGADLYKLLAQEFAPTSGTLGESDTSPAERFLGFLMSFAIRQGNVATLSGMASSFGLHLDELREYGEIMAKNLGLGRLARQALKPLIQTLVADPLQWQLNEQYTPKRLSEIQLIHALWRGLISQAVFEKEMAQAGFSSDRAQQIIEDARPLVDPAEIAKGFFYTKQTTEAMKLFFARRGWSDDEADKLILALRPRVTKEEILDLYLYGPSNRDDTSEALQQLGYTPEDAGIVIEATEARHNIVNDKRKFPTKHLGLGELKKAYLDLSINLLEFKSKLSAQGYSDDDVRILELDVIAEQAHKKNTPAGHAAPHLSLAQLKAALTQGIMSPTDVTAHLKALNYSDTDSAVILAEFEAAANKTAAKTPPATAG